MDARKPNSTVAFYALPVLILFLVSLVQLIPGSMIFSFVIGVLVGILLLLGAIALFIKLAEKSALESPKMLSKNKDIVEHYPKLTDVSTMLQRTYR